MGRDNIKTILRKSALGVATVLIWTAAVVMIAVCGVLVALRNVIDWIVGKICWPLGGAAEDGCEVGDDRDDLD